MKSCTISFFYSRFGGFGGILSKSDRRSLSLGDNLGGKTVVQTQQGMIGSAATLGGGYIQANTSDRFLCQQLNASSLSKSCHNFRQQQQQQQQMVMAAGGRYESDSNSSEKKLLAATATNQVNHNFLYVFVEKRQIFLYFCSPTSTRTSTPAASPPSTTTTAWSTQIPLSPTPQLTYLGDSNNSKW